MVTIYEALTESVKLSPEDNEDPQDFYERLFRAVNALEEGEWEELPEEAQHWANDASDALTAKQPIQMCPGSPFTQGTEEDSVEETPPQKKTMAAKKKIKPAVAKREAPEKVTKEKVAKEKVAKEPKAPREKKIGVLDLLMEAVYNHPGETPQQLAARVEKDHPGMEVKIANAIGIRQQYRRIIGFVQGKGHAKDLVIR